MTTMASSNRVSPRLLRGAPPLPRQRKLSLYHVLLVVAGLPLVPFLSLRETLIQLDEQAKHENSMDTATTIPVVSSCRDYKPFPWPDHHSGLPYLGDVFASHDAQFVYFIGINRYDCRHEYAQSDQFAAYKGQGHRFICAFPENTLVISEYIHPTHPHNAGFIIRCHIPKQFQHLVHQPQNYTTLHVDLHAMEDLETPPSGIAKIRSFPSMEITDIPKLSQIPICPANDRILQPRQYKLIAFVRVMSTYVLGYNTADTINTTVSTLPKILEWMEYHKSQGFDHFVIYDNDATPHGPLETMLKPYVESGLVTYRWFPMEDCWKDHSQNKGARSDWSQVVGSLSVLHRMGHAAEFYAHLDVDEYFVPLQDKTTVLQMMQATNVSLDAIKWKPTIMVPCNGTLIKNTNTSILKKWKCLSDKHRSDVKLIMRPERMRYFYVHYPVLTVDGERPTEYTLNDATEGFLAHYRPQPTIDYWRDDFVGLVRNDYTNETHFMDNFLSKQE